MAVEVAAPCLSCGGWRSDPPRNDCTSPGSHSTPEPHQIWLKMGVSYQLKGTGATHPFVEDEPRPCQHFGHERSMYTADGVAFQGHRGGDAEWLYTFICAHCEYTVTKEVCDGLRKFLGGRRMRCRSCGMHTPSEDGVFYTPLNEES